MARSIASVEIILLAPPAHAWRLTNAGFTSPSLKF